MSAEASYVIDLDADRTAVAHKARMPRSALFRDRTATQLRDQAEQWREAAERDTTPEKAAALHRLAGRYEVLAQLQEIAEGA